ncbi:hypothetical protein V6N11_051440 [Hibiscus sabdariffa]|uniref:Reverse transcriptase zinc-binding domain-containing protein n=1 Tax=Hibiscus sabdariffa TaxID=183260 RepID=A0ABR2U792_9ROSI
METIIRNPKKARRLDDDPPDVGGSNTAGFVPSAAAMDSRPTSYKDSLIGESTSDDMQEDEPFDDDDIEILEGDVTRMMVDGLISIQFLKRVQSLAEKSLDRTIVLKLLGRRIGYETLKNKIHELWKPKREVKLMDIDNGCGKYGHVSESCLGNSSVPENLNLQPALTAKANNSTTEAFGPWILVEKRQRRPTCQPPTTEVKNTEVPHRGSQFNPLSDELDDVVEVVNGIDCAPTVGTTPSVAQQHKGKSISILKKQRAIPIHKPLTVTLNDFPIITKSAAWASSSRSIHMNSNTTTLDKTRHSSIVISEKSDPNLPAKVHDANSACTNNLTLGKPPDPSGASLTNVSAEGLCRKQTNSETIMDSRIDEHTFFTADDVPKGRLPVSGRFPSLPQESLSSLGDIPSDQEIYEALMAMAPLKSPDLMTDEGNWDIQRLSALFPGWIFLISWLSNVQALSMRLMTHAERCRRNLSSNPYCLECSSPLEIALHTLRDCPAARNLWLHFLPESLAHSFFSLTLHDWISCNFSSAFLNPWWKIPWHFLFVSLIWQIWKRRNDVVFHNPSLSDSALIS